MDLNKHLEGKATFKNYIAVFIFAEIVVTIGSLVTGSHVPIARLLGQGLGFSVLPFILLATKGIRWGYIAALAMTIVVFARAN